MQQSCRSGLEVQMGIAAQGVEATGPALKTAFQIDERGAFHSKAQRGRRQSRNRRSRVKSCENWTNRSVDAASARSAKYLLQEPTFRRRRIRQAQPVEQSYSSEWVERWGIPLSPGKSQPVGESVEDGRLLTGMKACIPIAGVGPGLGDLPAQPVVDRQVRGEPGSCPGCTPPRTWIVRREIACCSE